MSYVSTASACPPRSTSSLGDDGYSDFGAALLAIAGSAVAGGYVGYKKVGVLGVLGGVVLAPTALIFSFALYHKFKNRNVVCQPWETRTFVGMCNLTPGMCPPGEEKRNGYCYPIAPPGQTTRGRP